jgi:hypothetical protein
MLERNVAGRSKDRAAASVAAVQHNVGNNGASRSMLGTATFRSACPGLYRYRHEFCSDHNHFFHRV